MKKSLITHSAQEKSDALGRSPNLAAQKINFSSLRLSTQTIRAISLTIILIGFLLYSDMIYADKWRPNKSTGGGKQTEQNKQIAEGCLSAAASMDLEVNNVRARINTGGDMWWDLANNAEYFIPKNTVKTSMFSASLWIGGLDVNGQLKLAAQRYRGNGDDFWTGPLSIDGTASIDAETCDKYDRHFKITRMEVEEFIAAFEADPTLSGYDVPLCIEEYPAHGDQSKNQSYYLAPFFDYDGDGSYDYTKGDYPYYDFDNVLCPTNYPAGTPQPATMEGNGILVDQILKGDETLYWIFNDKGNIHSETQGAAIGMEIRAQAFGFATNDEINNMTFYTYELINRSTYKLTETYFSQWVDTDLGDAKDDFVGCDILRGLGYCYNGVDPDGTGKPQDYGAQPPAVGVDFFQGPYMDPDELDNYRIDGNGDLICDVGINGVNFGDSIVDNERFGMRRFVYHNNTGPFGPILDPQTAPEYYNFLRGIWKDGERMRYWGNGHPVGGGTGPECDFMFPGDTDPCDWGTAGVPPGNPPYWTEEQAENDPNDRRFMQSAGPFTLEPGAVNYITVGIPWARATSGGPWASVELLKLVDDKCQALFDNCFKVLDGPDAPDLVIQELDRELILYITNRKGSSNNYGTEPEDYQEVDQAISQGDSLYRFEGYQIFQLKDATVSIADLKDPDLSRLVAQCDIKNGVTRMINYYYSEQLGAPVPYEEVNGADEGIVHSFRLFEDQFASGNKRLINHKQYYFIAIAYAYNNFKTYNPTDPLALDGQKLPYKAGRKAATGGIKSVAGIPHISSPENGGTIINSEYGVMPKITRIEGQGNGGNTVDLTGESMSQIMSGPPWFLAELEYDYNAGPINVRVVDPLNVAAGEYTLKFECPSGVLSESRWTLYNDITGAAWASEKTIAVKNEQLLLDIGLAVTIEQCRAPGDLAGVDNGFIESSISFADNTKRWLAGIYDIDGVPSWNWIRSGSVNDNSDGTNNDYNAPNFIDPDEFYEKILGGSWAPYRLCSNENNDENGPAWSAFLTLTQMKNLAGVNVYITSDRTLWTRCPVMEMSEDENYLLAEGNRKKFELRAGQTDGEVGMGWFPGFAINVETGERLNMIFGEDSWLQSENGRDMLWNPTSNYTTDLGVTLFGGKHWTYIVGHNGDNVSDCPAYDGGAWIKSKIEAGDATSLRYLSKDIMWVGGPMVMPGFEFTNPEDIPCDVLIRIRVSKPYARYFSTVNSGLTSPQNENYPMYTFSTQNMAVLLGNQDAAHGALELINVVPNPYYAYSDYEQNQLDNRVRITNLPERCVVTIYTISGTMIRQYAKDDPSTSLDWDLKNYAGIPIAGGLYLIHVNVEGVGEKVIKWFGSLRPIDLNSF